MQAAAESARGPLTDTERTIGHNLSLREFKGGSVLDKPLTKRIAVFKARFSTVKGHLRRPLLTTNHEIIDKL